MSIPFPASSSAIRCTGCGRESSTFYSRTPEEMLCPSCFAGLSDKPAAPLGWICPRCGSVWAPDVLDCARCRPCPCLNTSPFPQSGGITFSLHLGEITDGIGKDGHTA